MSVYNSEERGKENISKEKVVPHGALRGVSLKDFPICESCIVFIKTIDHPDRALACETARACGVCSKDTWKEVFEVGLRKKLAESEEIAKRRHVPPEGLVSYSLIKELLGT